MDNAAGLAEFRTLSSTKQNVEIFKILSGISAEIENLKSSTARRFSMLEELVNPSPVAKSHRKRSETIGGSTEDHPSRASKRWDTVRLNRSYNHYKNMAG